MNCESVPATVKTLLGVLDVPEKVTFPRNRPGRPETAGSVYRLAFGFRTLKRGVEKVSESLSVTIMIWTLEADVCFGSSTVTSTDSSHSYRLVRSTVIVAH